MTVRSLDSLSDLISMFAEHVKSLIVGDKDTSANLVSSNTGWSNFESVRGHVVP
jgi:hypothetical protein